MKDAHQILVKEEHAARLSEGTAEDGPHSTRGRLGQRVLAPVKTVNERILGARRFPGGRAQTISQRRVIVLIPEVGQSVLFHDVGIAGPYFGDHVGSQSVLIYGNASHVPEEVPIDIVVDDKLFKADGCYARQ